MSTTRVSSLSLRLVLRALVVAAALSSTACVHVRPWERGKLAHYTMAGDMTSPAEEHLHAVQEGAVGGTASASSGCGCN
jgi:hypothetical protein